MNFILVFVILSALIGSLYVSGQHQIQVSSNQNKAEFNHSKQFDQEAIDTMVHTFKSLPPSEVERLGIDLSADIIIAGTQSSQVLIEAWVQRQAEIRQLFESIVKPAELMADISKNLLNSSLADDMITHNLVELESLLSDVDNARDFHSIGGWPVLVSYLSHHRTTKHRELAALAVGSAIKNQYDYQLWVLESLQSDSKVIQENSITYIRNSTCLDLLIDIISVNELEWHLPLLQRTIYAISASARGNVEVQEVLARDTRFMGALAKLSSSKSLNIIRKLWAFVDDMLTDSALFAETYQSLMDSQAIDNVDVEFMLLGNSFCSNDWTERSAIAFTDLVKVDATSSESVDYRYSINSLFDVMRSQLLFCTDIPDDTRVILQNHLSISESNKRMFAEEIVLDSE